MHIQFRAKITMSEAREAALLLARPARTLSDRLERYPIGIDPATMPIWIQTLVPWVLTVVGVILLCWVTGEWCIVLGFLFLVVLLAPACYAWSNRPLPGQPKRDVVGLKEETDFVLTDERVMGRNANRDWEYPWERVWAEEGPDQFLLLVSRDEIILANVPLIVIPKRCLSEDQQDEFAHFLLEAGRLEIKTPSPPR